MENIKVRKEVRAIIKHVTPYLDTSKVIPSEFIDGIIDDVMGLFNSEMRNTYTEQAVNTMMSKKSADYQREKDELYSTIQNYASQVDQLKVRNEALQKSVSTDTVKKELERKIATLQDKNNTLKNIVRASLEDL